MVVAKRSPADVCNLIGWVEHGRWYGWNRAEGGKVGQIRGWKRTSKRRCMPEACARMLSPPEPPKMPSLSLWTCTNWSRAYGKYLFLLIGPPPHHAAQPVSMSACYRRRWIGLDANSPIDIDVKYLMELQHLDLYSPGDRSFLPEEFMWQLTGVLLVTSLKAWEFLEWAWKKQLIFHHLGKIKLSLSFPILNGMGVGLESASILTEC